MYDASSLSRNLITEVTSSGIPTRPRSEVPDTLYWFVDELAFKAWVRGVSTVVGAIALISIPSSAHQIEIFLQPSTSVSRLLVICVCVRTTTLGTWASITCTAANRNCHQRRLSIFSNRVPNLFSCSTRCAAYTSCLTWILPSGIFLGQGLLPSCS